MKKQVRLTGITSLLDELRDVYSEVRSGRMNGKEAAGLTNIASTMIRAANSKSSYLKRMGSEEKIEFLEN